MKKFHFVVFSFIFLFATAALSQEAPSLPAGLNDNKGPSLPSGQDDIGGPSLPSGLGSDEGPSLPGGLGDDSDTGKPASAEADHPKWYSVTGFWEMRGGIRTQSDPYEKDASLGETRVQLEFETRWQDMTLRIRPDFLYDPVMDDYDTDLEEGRGIVDLREASLSFSPLDFADIKIGRQIITWGTGDMLFINDMFPKDWQSFFIGPG